ncbi:hypothetical protein FIBSPDRAFT_901395 [Athelia psychrophila]|uniref:Uncharacterized protein n=1 Tax=Athelia psychrophila TaxID=1759441 RepID=A0A165X6A2_9AGAM|nr:hypothetical protein FIBSPDRAFT_901395 [Fibularhizoctonia sp. CBS 109695]
MTTEVTEEVVVGEVEVGVVEEGEVERGGERGQGEAKTVEGHILHYVDHAEGLAQVLALVNVTIQKTSVSLGVSLITAILVVHPVHFYHVVSDLKRQDYRHYTPPFTRVHILVTHLVVLYIHYLTLRYDPTVDHLVLDHFHYHVLMLTSLPYVHHVHHVHHDHDHHDHDHESDLANHIRLLNVLLSAVSAATDREGLGVLRFTYFVVEDFALRREVLQPGTQGSGTPQVGHQRETWSRVLRSPATISDSLLLNSAPTYDVLGEGFSLDLPNGLNCTVIKEDVDRTTKRDVEARRLAQKHAIRRTVMVSDVSFTT